MTDRSVVYRLQAEVGQFKAQMAQAGASVKDAADRMTAADKEGARFRSGLNQVGDTAGKVGLVAAAGLGAAVKASMDWETAWAGVTKTVDGSASQMATLEGQLREMARTMPATHTEIAAVAEAAGQLGVQRDSIASFTETMIQLGETTNLSADDAATAIAQMSNVMRTAPEDVDNLGAALVALGNDGASTERDIIFMAQRISAAGAQIGLVESDILAIANAAASMGVEVEAGGTAISRVFTEIAKAAASGGPKLDEFARVAGLSATEFTRLFEETPADAFAAFTSGLDQINKSGGDVFSTLEGLGMSDVRVSQALLGMAASGDLLTDSLNLGREAWSENTALAEEYAKRADTTAAQVQVSWNNIKDAAISAGESMLPVVEGVANTVSSLAETFGKLPGPVKGAIGPLTAMTAIFGGGLWFTAKTVTGIANMRQAFSDLTPEGVRASGSLGKVARSLGVVAGAATAAMVFDEFVTAVDEAPLSIEETTRALLGMGDAASSAALSGDLDRIAESVDRLMNKRWNESTDDAIRNFLGPLAGDAEDLKEAKADIESLDQALVGLVNSVGLAGAEDYFTRFGAAAGLTAFELDNLATDHLPGYIDAIAGVQNESSLAAASTNQFEGAAGGLGDSLMDAEAAAESFSDMMKSLNAVLDGRASLRDYEAALDDFTDTLKENGKTFDITTAKGRANQAALDDIAGSALRVAESMEAGDRQRFLTASIKDLRTMGQEMGLPKAEIQRLIELLRTARDTDVKPKVDVDTSDAMRKARELKAYLEGMHGRQYSSTFYTDRITRYRQEGRPAPTYGPLERAQGGPVFGPGTATSDSIPAYLSNGEYVVKAAAVEKYGTHMFDSLNAMRFADGGKVDKKRPRFSVGEYVDPRAEDRRARIEERLTFEQEMLRRSIEGLNERVSDQTDAVRDSTSAYDAVVSRMEQAGAASVAGFQTGLFERDSNIWGSGAGGGWFANLSKDIAGLTERNNLQNLLAAQGLTGDALAAVLAQGTNADLSALEASGRVGEFQAFYNQRAQMSAATAYSAGQHAYGAEAALAAAELVVVQAQLAESVAVQQHMSRQLEVLTNKQEQVAALSGTAAGRAFVSAGNQIARRRRRDA